MSIPGAHVYWTRPRGPEAPLMSPLERAVLAASAITWRAQNGPVWLFTDERGRDEMAAMGLLPLWDRVDLACLETIAADIPAHAFWDIGKAIVLSALPQGACILDLDLVIWEPFTPGEGVSFLHWETPVLPWYPGPEGLSAPAGYAFDRALDWNAPVCNTAFLCCPDPGLCRAFADGALAFARGNWPAGAGIAEMLFAGQRLLAHTLSARAAKPKPLIDYLYVPCGESRWLTAPLVAGDPLTPEACERGVPFTHLWRHKHILRERAAKAEAFRDLLVRRCRARAGPAVEPWLPILCSQTKETPCVTS